jgi:cell division transport system permease protein
VPRRRGAPDAFVRRPLLYLGLLQGLAGGVLALAILGGGLAILNQGVSELAQAYGSSFRLAFLSWSDASSLVVFAGFLGWFGSSLSVSKYLR